MKAKHKKRGAWSTNISKQSPEPKENEEVSEEVDEDQQKKYPRNRVKKKDQYRNQVIEDQFGIFKYDEDPDGYLKARKRMLNRKSALRTRSRKSTKVEVLNDKIKNLEKKSSSLEEQNKQLKGEKDVLQQQVSDLLAMLNQMNSGTNLPDLHKRIKTGELEEQLVEKYDSGTTEQKLNSHSESDFLLGEEEESELFSSGEDDSCIRKTENWLNQNDILNHVKDIPSKGRSSSTKENDNSFCSGTNFPDRSNEQVANDQLILHRGEDQDDLFNSLFGENVGNILSQASMLTLTIVMCLILCFCGVDQEEKTTIPRDYHSQTPGMRNPMSADYFESTSYLKSYMKIGLVTFFLLATIVLKCSGWLKRLSFTPKHHPVKREN